MITKFGSQPHLPDVNEFSHSLDLYFDDSAIDEHKSIFVDENTQHMMTSSNGNIFRVTRHLWWESTGDRWILLTKASDAELWCFLWYAHNKRLSKQSRCRWFETPPSSLWRHCNVDEITGVWNVAYQCCVIRLLFMTSQPCICIFNMGFILCTVKPLI